MCVTVCLLTTNTVGTVDCYLKAKKICSLARPQSGKFGGTSSEAQENQPQGIQSAEEAAEHENMKAVLKSGLREGDSGTSTVPGLRTRTRAGNARGPPPCIVHSCCLRRSRVQQCLQ